VFALSAGIAGLGGALYAMQQQSITAVQFSFQAGLPIFLLAVVSGLASVGSGLSAGALLIGPINMLIAVAPRLQNFTALLPGLAGIGLGRNPDGVVPYFRRDWAPVLRHRIALALALAASAALWVLRLVGAVNGWVLFWGVAAVAVALRIYVATRPQPSAEPEPAQATVPPEWLGLRRPWRAEDEEVLDRAVARG